MKVAAWIDQYPKDPVTVNPESPFETIIEELLACPCLRDIYVQSEEGTLIGHITYRRLAHLLLAEHRPEHTMREIMERIVAGTAKEIMELHFATAKPEEELDEVLHRQLDHDMEDMPVIGEDGMPLGVINLTQVLQVFLREAGNAE